MNINGLRYEIKGIEKRTKFLSNKGCIEAHLNGNFDYVWQREVSEYYVTARRNDEDWDRVLVFDESEFKQQFPTKKFMLSL